METFETPWKHLWEWRPIVWGIKKIGKTKGSESQTDYKSFYSVKQKEVNFYYFN